MYLEILCAPHRQPFRSPRADRLGAL